MRCAKRGRRHNGVVIGWTAQAEHAADLPRIPIVDVLGRLLDAHPQVRVETLGLDLALDSPRYLHRGLVPFDRLQSAMARWDVAIAPLSDIPFNRARSDVKLKEYAAARLPWLASPIGPYEGFGEEQGGRLVGDGDWYEALDDLVSDGRARKRLSRAGYRWARSQSIERAAKRWEALYAEAVTRRGARGDSVGA